MDSKDKPGSAARVASSDNTSSRRQPLLANLQGLRAFAAISVATFHFALVPASSIPWIFGSFGVDLFFVLSGFIIAYSTQHHYRHFLLRRAIRVLPTYWTVTTIEGLLVLLVVPIGPALQWYGQSLLFLTGADGRPPIIIVAWTLVYELAFYLVYAAALLVGGRRAPIIAIIALPILAFGPSVLGDAAPTWPLLVEFSYGLAIFLLVKRLGKPRPGRIPAAILSVGGLACLYFFESALRGSDGSIADKIRTLALGLPSAAVVLGLVLLERAGIGLRNRFILALGGASYAIYLLHPLIFSMVLALPAGSPGLRYGVFFALLAATLAVSLTFYRYVEAPMIRRLRRRLALRVRTEARKSNAARETGNSESR